MTQALHHRCPSHIATRPQLLPQGPLVLWRMLDPEKTVGRKGLILSGKKVARSFHGARQWPALGLWSAELHV